MNLRVRIRLQINEMIILSEQRQQNSSLVN